VPDVPGRFDDPDLLLLAHQLRYLLVHQIPSHYHIVTITCQSYLPTHVQTDSTHILTDSLQTKATTTNLLLDWSLRGTFYDRLEP
jgi:hypothetical protein